MNTLNSIDVWLVIIGLGIGTYSLRLSFLAIIGNKELPEWLLRHLRYTAVAIMPAMIAPLIVFPSATSGDISFARVIAATLAIIIGVWKGNVVLTIAVGIITLITLQYFGVS